MKKLYYMLLLITAALPYASIAQYANGDEARRFLLDGVAKIAKPGTPGPIILLSNQAFPIAVGDIGGGTKMPVVAGGYLGRGAVLAFGHGSYFMDDGFTAHQTTQLIANGLRWAGRNNNPRVLTRYMPALSRKLASYGLQVVQNNGEFLSAESLAAYDVFVLDPEQLNAAELANVAMAVKGGKGLLAGGLGWGWSQLNPSKSLNEMAGNVLLADAGIAWGNGYIYGEYIEAKINLSPYFSFGNSLQLVKSQSMKRASRTDYGQALAMVMQRLPYANTLPFAIENDFPGRVSEQAPRVYKQLSLPIAIPRWHSTGLYAAPGEEIIVQIPQSFVKKGYAVRIGAHTDQVYNHEKWDRHPELSTRLDLDQTVNKLFNPFGGAVYIEVPENQGNGLLSVSIGGAIEAPHFVLGKTNLSDWVNTLRNNPAPWAELEGEQLIISIQSDKIRDCARPDLILQFWDQAQENNRRLAHWSVGQQRPMRVVFDVQISAGYMHSGYPFMSMITPAGEQEMMLDVQGDHWGFYHELGHNHQHADWTFEGTVEVTCNLFTLYNIEHLQQKPRLIGNDQEGQVRKINKYFNEGSPFGRWKEDPFLALAMYDQLIGAYGWDVLQKVIQQYSLLSEAERPKTDQQKMDRWFVTYSMQVGQNLSNFFDKWGMPISQEAKRQVSTLPMANLSLLLANVKAGNIPKAVGVLVRFKHNTGSFMKRQVGNKAKWYEQDTNEKDIFSFEQYHEDVDYFYIRKDGTNMNLRVPKKEGWLQISYDNAPSWGDLYFTVPF